MNGAEKQNEAKRLREVIAHRRKTLAKAAGAEAKARIEKVIAAREADLRALGIEDESK